MSDLDDTSDPRSAIGAYVFAPNWIEARALVESDPWYGSEEAETEMARVTSEARGLVGSDPAGAISVRLFELAQQRLARARSHRAEQAYRDLETLDGKLENLGRASTSEELYESLAGDESLVSDRGLAGLRILILRAAAREDEQRGADFCRLEGVVKRVRAEGLHWLATIVAEATAGRLRDQLPERADAAQIAQAERAISLLEHDPGSRLWFELHLRLGSLLLESPAGARTDNVARAESAYRAVLAHATVETAPEAWAHGIGGLANALAVAPSTPGRTREALGLYEALIERFRAQGATRELAQTLGNCARLLASLGHGDTDAQLERAIEFQKEAVRLLTPRGDEPAIDPQSLGRALHNLGGFHQQLRTGVRSHNVDLAVVALEEALSLRRAEIDPVGHARTQRALALVYPEWSGADSLQHARDLAQGATDAADAIERVDATAAARTAGWARFAREVSALRQDLDGSCELPVAEHITWLNAVAANHVAAVEVIPRETQPVLWAEWMGGLGRVLGRLPSRGVWERLDEAYDCFKQAIRVVEPLDQPRLLRDLQGRFGEFCHEVGDWPGSFQACAVAVEIAYSLFDEFATRESRLVELQETRGFALCAAYAAFRLDRLDEAVRFAEAQRARSLVDVISAAEILRRAPIDVRDTILEILSRIAALESERASAGDDDPEVMLDRQRRKLADYLGVHPDLVGARLTGTAKEKLEQARTDPDRHTTALAQARQQLREAIAGASPATTDRFSKALDAGSIADIAGRARRPLVYLLSTVHGGAALVVSPEGELTGVPLDELTSDETRDLVDGEGNDPGFARAAFQGDNDALSASLERCLQVLSEKAMKPLSRWLTAHDHPGAILIPLGRLGLLPLHAAGAQGVYSYAPSARSLSISLAAGESKPRRPKLVVIAAPTREDERPLPFAVAAARSIEASAKQEQTPVSVLVREQASSASVRTAAGDGTLIHFACHGRFRPSDPLESHLLLGGEERLTVADVFAGAVDLFGARLVTLSACQTGNVEYYANPDESIGFPAALLLAGVRSVVTTLWPVDDAATALLCVHMYERIFADGEDCVTALELARDWLRNATADKLQIAAKQLRAALQDSDDDEDAALSRLWRNLAFREPESVPYATPEYWAGFVHVGA